MELLRQEDWPVFPARERKRAKEWFAGTSRGKKVRYGFVPELSSRPDLGLIGEVAEWLFEAKDDRVFIVIRIVGRDRLATSSLDKTTPVLRPWRQSEPSKGFRLVEVRLIPYPHVSNGTCVDRIGFFGHDLRTDSEAFLVERMFEIDPSLDKNQIRTAVQVSNPHAFRQISLDDLRSGLGQDLSDRANVQERCLKRYYSVRPSFDLMRREKVGAVRVSGNGSTCGQQSKNVPFMDRYRASRDIPVKRLAFALRREGMDIVGATSEEICVAVPKESANEDKEKIAQIAKRSLPISSLEISSSIEHQWPSPKGRLA